MNYYNPYFNAYPYFGAMNNAMNAGLNTATRGGLLSRIFGGGLNFSSILSGTQKTLNFANQALPLIRQAQPMLRNARTIFKVMNEFKKVDTPVNNATTSNTNTTMEYKKTDGEDSIRHETDYGPTFFQ